MPRCTTPIAERLYDVTVGPNGMGTYVAHHLPFAEAERLRRDLHERAGLKTRMIRRRTLACNPTLRAMELVFPPLFDNSYESRFEIVEGAAAAHFWEIGRDRARRDIRIVTMPGDSCDEVLEYIVPVYAEDRERFPGALDGVLYVHAESPAFATVDRHVKRAVASH
jgi:hypothetical protein